MLDANGTADADGLSDVGNPYTFTGRRLDLESDLMQYRNRALSLALGRFFMRDPIGYANAARLRWNLYAYADGTPVVFADPEGEEPITVIVIVIVAAGIYKAIQFVYDSCLCASCAAKVNAIIASGRAAVNDGELSQEAFNAWLYAPGGITTTCIGPCGDNIESYLDLVADVPPGFAF